MARILTHVRRLARDVRDDWAHAPERAVLDMLARRASIEARSARARSGRAASSPDLQHFSMAMAAATALSALKFATVPLMLWARL